MSALTSLALRAALLATALAAGGCATKATPEAPLPATPAQWRYAPPDRAGADPVSIDWWQSLGNAELDALVRRAPRRQSRHRRRIRPGAAGTRQCHHCPRTAAAAGAHRLRRRPALWRLGHQQRR
ncbi:hypothetical protein ACU4HD_42570 [Cupriavidus basilensis]